MSASGDSEIDQLWTKYAKQDLWVQVTEWWESASRARVVMVLAMNHGRSLTFQEIVDQAGASECSVRKMLLDLQDEGVLECREGSEIWSIVSEPAFLKHMQRCCRQTAVAAGSLGTLAGWASGSDSSASISDASQ